MVRTAIPALGSYLRALRFERGWTQIDTASHADISQTLVSQLETGERSLTYAAAAALERAFGLLRGHLDPYVEAYPRDVGGGDGI